MNLIPGKLYFLAVVPSVVDSPIPEHYYLSIYAITECHKDYDELCNVMLYKPFMFLETIKLNKFVVVKGFYNDCLHKILYEDKVLYLPLKGIAVEFEEAKPI